MILRSVSKRGVVLRDTPGNIYAVEAYGELEVRDSLLTDQEFQNMLRSRLRDLLVITAKMPVLVGAGEFAALTPYHADEVYLQVADGIRWHLVYNADSGSSYKWEFVGGPPLRTVVNTAEAIGSASAWSNLATDGPAVTAPRDGDYDCKAVFNTLHTASNSNAQVGIAVGNADATSPLAHIETDSADRLFGAVFRRLTGVSAGNSLKMRYYSSTSGELPTFSDRVLEVTPVRIG